jgi:PST family polysaccharide transporter
VKASQSRLRSGLGSPSTLIQNIISLFALQGANYILPLIVIPYLVRVLGPSNFGRLAFAQAFIVYFTIFVDYGFDLSATRKIALIKTDKVILSRYISTVIITKSMLALFGGVLVYAVTVYFDRFSSDPYIYLLCYTSVVGSVIFPTWLYRGLEYMKLMSGLTIFGRTTTVILLFIFVTDKHDLLWAATIQSSSLLIGGLPAIYLILRKAEISLNIPRISEMKETLTDGWHAFLSTSAITLYTNTNIFVLGLVVDAKIVGYFAAASRLILALNGLFSPINQAVYPHVVRVFSKSRDAAFRFMAKVLSFQLALAFLLCVGVFLSAGYIVRIIFGPEYHASILLLRIIFMLPFFSTLTNIFGVQIMMSLDLKQAFAKAIFLTAAVNLAIIYPLTKTYGATGAAAAVCFIEIFTPSVLLAYLVKVGIFTEILEGFRSIRYGSSRP